ncbi:MAG: hypothetical protein IPQ17_07225 [Xanthomonadales bacterium]|nr:hypothetical protein [Xanthomonadales bacterium]
MAASRFVEPYIEHGLKSLAVRKITVSIPLQFFDFCPTENGPGPVANLRHATNSNLLCEAFLHAFTGQPLPTDEELRRDMATKKTAAKKPAAKKPAARRLPKSSNKEGSGQEGRKKAPAKKLQPKRAAAKERLRQSGKGESRNRNEEGSGQSGCEKGARQESGKAAKK